MIYEVSGDILLTKAEAIAHGISPDDHFKQGLALALREKWPMMAKDYQHFVQQRRPKPGQVWTWGGFGARVFNLLTQEGDHAHGAKPGRASTANVNHCLKNLRLLIEKENIKSIALPKLATGVGGLDWKDVRPLIETHLGDLKIPVYVYAEYHKGVPAAETALT